jgi:cytochrome c-type biogenesis protein CcmF
VETLGTTVLSFAAVAAASAAALGCAAEGRPFLLRAAHRALHAASLLLLAALACLGWAFLAHDFSLRCVADYSDRATPLAYLVAGVWAGQAGSLLLWAAAVSCGCSLFLARRHRGGPAAAGDGWLTALAALSVLGLLVICLLHSNPFQPLLRSRPVDGVGLSGLLRNPLMAFHPPVLIVGFALTVVPALSAARALVRGDCGAEWVVEARPWALAAWALIGLGNVLGMLWAYEELGWGGYWGWDPVENASLLPWLASTAYLHAAAVAERRGMLLRTTAGLALATMVLPLFGTYLTRSGVVASQHAFASSPAASAFLLLLGITVAVCAGLLAWRWRWLGASGPRLESVFSREAGAALTVLVLAAMILAVAAATTAPLLGRLAGDDAVQVEPQGYARFVGPLGLLLLFLGAACPLLSYGRTAGRRAVAVLGVPAAAAVVAGIAMLVGGDAAGFGVVAHGRFQWFALGTFPLGVFIVVAAAADLVRGVRVRAREAGESSPAATRRFLGAGRRRAGGDVVHIGAALLFAGFAGASYQQDAEAVLRPAAGRGVPASSLDVGGYRLTYLGARDAETPEYAETQALVRIDSADGEAYLATPSLRRYRSGSARDTAEVAILSGLVDDVHVEVRGFSDGPGGALSAFLRVHVSPLTSLVWAGAIILLAGALLAWWPVRDRAGAAAPVPGSRLARSYASVVALAAFLVFLLESVARAALVVAGGVLLAAIWVGGAAVMAAVGGGGTTDEHR